jgi:negative regulator of sigma-B (phosphoserine phosphatase)
MPRQTAGKPAPVVEFGTWETSFCSGEENGDCYVVKTTEKGVLLAVADGLGHGPEAAAAAHVAMSCVENYNGQGIIPLFHVCHSSLKRTRGAVMNLAFFNCIDNTMTWTGVGNIEGILIRADGSVIPPRETLMLRGGVLGLNLPTLTATVMPIMPGDTLIFATDGITSNFADSLTLMDTPQKLADKIGGRFCKGTDDALVVAGRYRGR